MSRLTASPCFSQDDFPLVRLALAKLEGLPSLPITLTGESSINQRVYKQPSTTTRSGKPFGLWYGLGTSWIDYLEDGFTHPWGKYRSVFKLSLDKTALLCLDSPSALLAFEKKYLCVVPSTGFEIIDWLSVSKDYLGVELSPYQPSPSLMAWCNKWDVPSGCIWDTRAIASSELVYTSR